MRCPDCNKFVSFDTETEPEVEVNVDKTLGTITVEAHIVNTCADCGTELTTADFQMESEDLAEVVEEHKEECADFELLVESESFGRTDRRETHDKRGKPIKSRYQKQYYGVEGSVTVECKCGLKFEPVTLSDEIQSSAMEEC